VFQAVPPPIIKSSKLYIQDLVFVKPLLLSFAVVEVLELEPPIIRSSKLYLQHLVFVKPLLLPFAVVEELELESPIIRSSKTIPTAPGIC
jgi:hypothetical protein